MHLQITILLRISNLHQVYLHFHTTMSPSPLSPLLTTVLLTLSHRIIPRVVILHRHPLLTLIVRHAHLLPTLHKRLDQRNSYFPPFLHLRVPAQIRHMHKRHRPLAAIAMQVVTMRQAVVVYEPTKKVACVRMNPHIGQLGDEGTGCSGMFEVRAPAGEHVGCVEPGVQNGGVVW